MAYLKKWLLRRGTTDQLNNRTPELSEITFDTTKKSIRIGDGVTPGGKEFINTDDLTALLDEHDSNGTNINILTSEPETQENNTVVVYPSVNRLNPITTSMGPSVLWNYSESKDYAVGSVVVHNNRMYLCLTANGVGSNVVIPGSDPAVWSLVPIESELHAGRLIDELVYSISPLTDSSVHLADGSLIANGAYAQYYAKKLADYNNADVVANARQIGNLTNNNGVYSGFSATDYLKTDLPFSPSNNPWEFLVKISTGNDVSSGLIISATTKTYQSSLNIGLSSGHFTLSISDNGSSWSNVGVGNYNVSANTDYWLKVSFSGTAYTLNYSLNGSNYVTDISISSSSTIYAGTFVLLGINRDISQPWLGSIDLNETYIKINNVLWWQGAVKKGFTNEAYWQSFVSKYGSCGKFVIDTVNETIRLPKLTGFLEGTVDLNALSELKEAGLPNIEGQFANAFTSPSPALTGVFKVVALGAVVGTGSGSNSQATHFSFDASHSNPIFGNSPTVQPQSISAYVYIVIANAQKTAIAVDIDNVMTDINLLSGNKADKDFSNITDSASALMAHNAMPSINTYDEITLGASGTTYTAPADGYIYIDRQTSAANQEIVIAQLGNVKNFHYAMYSPTAGQPIKFFVPIKKGMQFQVFYSSNSTLTAFRFIYAEGLKND